MKRTILSSIVATALGCASAVSAAQTPLDFDYVASGHEKARPALVFNDGRDTWIQPGSGKEIEVVGMPSRRSGPYIVVPGLPERIVVSSGGATGVIARLGSPDAWAAPATRCSVEKAHVSFQKLRSYLDDRGERAIASIIQEARRAERIVVTGHPDAKSRTLAENRARRVKERLSAAGVQDSIIEIRVDLQPSPGREAEIEMRMPCRIVPASSRTERTAQVGIPAVQSPTPTVQDAMRNVAGGQTEAAQAVNAKPQDVMPGPAVAAAGQAAPERAAVDAEPSRDGLAQPDAPPSGTLRIRAGERLSQALRAFLALHGVGLEWRAKNDLEIPNDVEIGGKGWKETVAAAMEAAGFSAVLVRENNTVYVTD